MRSTALGVGAACVIAAAANATVTGLQVEYDGLVGGRHVWSVYAVSNDVNNVMLNVIGHSVISGSMSGVQHNDFGGGVWIPTLTILPDQIANDSFVTVTGLAGAAAGTNLDPSFGSGTGSAIPQGAGWLTANPGTPILFTGGRIKIMQVAGSNLYGAGGSFYLGRLTIGYKLNVAATTPLYAENLTYQIGVEGPPDSDSDGIPDGSDNCPAIANPMQEDLDADGIGDVCDPDRDGDGVSNQADGCPDNGALQSPAQYFTDSDNDGFGTSATALLCVSPAPPGYSAQSGDCDDSRADVSPNGQEVCDPQNTDEDCDGLINNGDPDVVGAALYWRDADADSFPGTTMAMVFCPGLVPPGWLLAQGSTPDCNDFNPSVYPGAPELCATVGVDNDCDGDADEATDQRPWYLDADGDAYGDDETKTIACNPPGPGWILTGGDGCPMDQLKQLPGICGCGVADTDTDFDTVADCIDNCASTPNPDQADCDGDGYGTACSDQSDCNENGLPDHCEIASGHVADIDGNGVPDSCQDDCNLNGLPDEYEVSQGLVDDCDSSGVPDECEDGYIEATTGNMGAVGAGQPLLGTLLGQRLASTPVQVRVEVRGDLDGTPEFITMTLNGIAVGGDLFRTDGSECDEEPDQADVIVSPTQWRQVMDEATTVGEVRVRIVASPAVSTTQCTSALTIVSVAYGGPDFDCDGDGQPDSCQLAAGEGDCDANGLFDACERGGPGDVDSDGIPDACERRYGDLNIDGFIDGIDLSFLLASWGSPTSTLGDLDGNGVVDGVDLAFLLARWGPVP